MPLHWLCFWDDHKSIDFLLSTVNCNDLKTIHSLFAANSTGLTPIDLAGSHKATVSILIMLQFFTEHFEIIEKVFDDKKSN